MSGSSEQESSPTTHSTEDASEKDSSGDSMSVWLEAVRDVAPYLDLGWRLAGSAAFPPLLGYFAIDAWLGTTPWGLLSGCVLGLAASVLQLTRIK